MEVRCTLEMWFSPRTWLIRDGWKGKRVGGPLNDFHKSTFKEPKGYHLCEWGEGTVLFFSTELTKRDISCLEQIDFHCNKYDNDIPNIYFREGPLQIHINGVSCPISKYSQGFLERMDEYENFYRDVFIRGNITRITDGLDPKITKSKISLRSHKKGWGFE